MEWCSSLCLLVARLAHGYAHEPGPGSPCLGRPRPDVCVVYKIKVRRCLPHPNVEEQRHIGCTNGLVVWHNQRPRRVEAQPKVFVPLQCGSHSTPALKRLHASTEYNVRTPRRFAGSCLPMIRAQCIKQSHCHCGSGKAAAEEVDKAAAPAALIFFSAYVQRPRAASAWTARGVWVSRIVQLRRMSAPGIGRLGTNAADSNGLWR